MTPRETTAVSSTTSAYSSCLVTPTATPSSSTTTTSSRSSTCVERSLVQEVQLDPNASATTTPMPHHGGSSSAKRVAAEASPSTSLLAVQTKHVKKRRRIGVVCRTHSPTASPHNSPKAFKAVKRIPPTLPGVQKAAQVLHENGIVVFPTERTYEACVRWSPEPWKRHVSPFFAVAFQSSAPLHPTSITTTTTSLSSSSPSGYHVYVPKQKLCQLDKLLGFPKKAYALKPPLLASSSSSPSPSLSPSSSTTFPTSTTTATTPTCQKIYYFSETRWILHRLAQRYWPGPVKIYVPVRAASALPCELLQPLPTPPSTNQGIMSHNSTTNTINAAATAAPTATTTTTTTDASCVRASAVEQTTACHATATNTTTTSTSATHHGTTASILHYIGLRCPSHPLTARILQEALVCTSSPSDVGTNTYQQSLNPQPSIPHSWWLGLPVQGSSEPSSSSSSFLTTAQEVAQQVLLRTCKLNQPGSMSPTLNSISAPTATSIPGAPNAMTVHVVNGEDKRELFAVPTCQHSSSISLWIDDTSRTIHVFGKESNSTVPFSVQQLERLLQEDDQEGFGFLRGGSFSTDSPILGPRPVPSPGDAPQNLEADGRQRVIRAVLRKWKVVHYAGEG